MTEIISCDPTTPKNPAWICQELEAKQLQEIEFPEVTVGWFSSLEQRAGIQSLLLEIIPQHFTARLYPCY